MGSAESSRADVPGAAPKTVRGPARPGMLSSAVGRPSPAHVNASSRPKPDHGGPPQIMAKRARGSTTRPGQRPPLQRQATRPVTPATSVQPRPATLTAQEEARAGELEAAIVAEERQAEESKRRARTVRTTDDAVGRSASPLSVVAAEEYAYVARDVRRIALLGGTLIAALFGLWAVVQVTGFGPF